MSVPNKSQAGFTLIELLIAVVILAIGLLGLAQLQVTAIKTNSQTATKAAAIALAQRAIEDITAWEPNDARLDTSGTANLTTSPIEVLGAGTYTIEYTVTVNYNGVTNLCRVDVAVESESDVMGVLGYAKREATAHTLKRSI